MIFQALCGFLPFLDAISDSVTDLHSSIAFEGPSYSGQYISGLNNDTDEVKSIRVIEDDSDYALGWQLWTLDLLDTSHVHVDLVFPCACHTHTASVVGSRPSSRRSSHTKAILRSRSSRGSGSSLQRLVATHEEYLTYAVVVATLQVFLRLTRANVTTLFLPMLAQATGCGRSSWAAQMGDAVLVVVTTCGVLGSALAARQLGREAMCAISGVLIVFCQVHTTVCCGIATWTWHWWPARDATTVSGTGGGSGDHGGARGAEPERRRADDGRARGGAVRAGVRRVGRVRLGVGRAVLGGAGRGHPVRGAGGRGGDGIRARFCADAVLPAHAAPAQARRLRVLRRLDLVLTADP